MKIDALKSISFEDYPDAPEWFERYLSAQNQTTTSLVQAVRGNLSIADNTTSGFHTSNFTHGVEKLIRNPLKVSPIGVKAILVERLPTDAASTTLQKVANISMRYIQGKDPNAPEQLGVMIEYDLKHTKEYIERFNNAGQVLTTATTTPISWASANFTAPADSAITIASNGGAPLNTRIVVSEPGAYGFLGHLTWNSNATGVRQVWASKNTAGAGNTEFRGLSEVSAVNGDSTSLDFAFAWKLVAGDYVEIFGYQNSGGNLALSTGLTCPELQAFRIRNDSTPTARVTLELIGG